MTLDVTQSESLRTSIYNTVVYFDLFDFAPTLLELQRWLLRDEGTENQKASLHTLATAVAQDARLEQTDGVVHLAGRSELADIRKQKYNYTDEKWKHAQRFLPWLAIMPGVEAIWFGNSVAWCNARHQSDIDLIIITTPSRIWTARFFTTALMKLFRQRPHEQDHSRALCLSFYTTSDNLNMQPYMLDSATSPVEDIHFSYWTTQMYPLYDPLKHYDTYRSENAWVEQAFQHSPWMTAVPRRRISIGFGKRFFKRLLSILTAPFESALKALQLQIMPAELRDAAKNGTTVVLSDNILKLHTNDNRAELQQRWEQRIAIPE